FGDGAHLRRQVGGELVHVVGEVLPRARRARDARLAAELALDAYLARHGRHLIPEGGERVDHPVDGVGQRRDLALRLDRQLPREVALRHRGDHLRDAADLIGQVAGHEVHVVGQVLPGAGDALHAGLARQDPLGADLARDARHLRGERAQLIHHRVDGVLQLQDLALDVDRDLLGEVAGGDGRRHLGDVAHLAGAVAGHAVHAVGHVLPGAGDALHVGLPAELALLHDALPISRHLRGERAQLIHHRVDGVFQLQDLALDVDRDLLREVAGGDGRGHLGDVALLAGQVAGHGVHAVGQVLPGAGDALDVGLPAELALGADLGADARPCSTIVLMVFFSSRISPLTSTVIFFERSPVATAVVTSAMLRTWPVRFPAMKFTLSVRSFQVPATPLTSAWPPSFPSVPTSRATRVTSDANDRSWSTMRFTVFAVRRNSPSSGRSSMSSAIACERSPLATAPMTRAISLVGCTRSPISALTEPSEAAHAPLKPPSDARWVI